MNFLRRCVGSTATLPPPLSLSSRTFLRTVTQSSPYSTNLWSMEHSSSSIRSPELNEQATQPMAADSSRSRDINFVEGFYEKAQEYVSKKEIADNAWRDLMKNPNQWLNFADDKSKGLVSPKHPDFKHTENGSALWLYCAPEWVVARIESLDLDSKEKMWKSLAENPDQWWDNRENKKNEKAPDFKHKKTNVGLWLAGKPEWFVDTKADAWKSLAENPDQWWDHRADKNTEKSPDFKHKETGAGLWLVDKPEWFVAKDTGNLKDTLKDTKEDAWKSLVENPSQWWDNRAVKKNVKSPDFKHKDSGVKLWLEHAPDLVVSKLPQLKQNQNVGAV